MRVLVVEDERRVALHIAQALTEESFAVDVAPDGERALALIETHQYDAVVLDLMLPRLEGLAVCRRMRQSGNRTPVLILSARDLVDDRVRGLDAGADDYLVKPFAIEELLARLRALLRRNTGSRSPVLSVGDLRLDPATRSVRRGSDPISLTAREYALVAELGGSGGHAQCQYHQQHAEQRLQPVQCDGRLQPVVHHQAGRHRIVRAQYAERRVHHGRQHTSGAGEFVERAREHGVQHEIHDQAGEETEPDRRVQVRRPRQPDASPDLSVRRRQRTVARRAKRQFPSRSN